jgi:hypothetical protein
MDFAISDRIASFGKGLICSGFSRNQKPTRQDSDSPITKSRSCGEESVRKLSTVQIAREHS